MKKIAIITAVLLVLPFLAFAGTLPDTGQTSCYDDTQRISCPQPGEPFYGQDAQYITNRQSYTKLDENGDDLPDEATEWVLVRDNVTGLIWEVKDAKDDTPDYSNPHDADNTYTWYDSNPATNGGDPGTPGDGTDTEDFIYALNDAQFGGFSDWRLATVKELSFIVDSGRSVPSIDQSYFTNTVSSVYFSSTSIAPYASLAWCVNFKFRYVDSFSKANHYYVRAVRGGQPFNNFIDNGDGTVADLATGLMWQQATAPGAYTWEEALAYCEDLILNIDGEWTYGTPNLSGAKYDDWRLPDRNQLQSIVDYSTYQPAFNTTYFPDTVSYSYRSSTSYASNALHVWAVYFSLGRVGLSLKDKLYYVRAVRGGGQCGSFGDSDDDGICDDGDDNGTPFDNPCTGGVTAGCDDNCPDNYNHNQADIDGDGMGNACDPLTIPTLSDWGLIIFMTIIMGLGVVTLFRRRIE